MMTYDDVLLCGCKMAAIGRIFYLFLLGLSCAQQAPFTFKLDGADWMLRDANGNVTNVAAEVPGQAHVDLMYVCTADCTRPACCARDMCNVSTMTCFISCLEAMHLHCCILVCTAGRLASLGTRTVSFAFELKSNLIPSDWHMHFIIK